MSSILFNFTSDGTTHDASVSEISESQLVCFDHGWALSPEFDSLDGNPTYSIEVANVDTPSEFGAYDTPTLDAAIDQPFDDDHLLWQYIRINYKAVDNTTGTVKFEMNLK